MKIKYQDMALVKHKLLMAKSCCTFKVSKKFKCTLLLCLMSLTLYSCAEKYTKMKMKMKADIMKNYKILLQKFEKG